MKVVLHVKGGLGNQLIQYAFIQKYFSEKNADIILDTTHFKFLRERQFFLKDFPYKKVSIGSTSLILIRMYIRILFKKLYKLGLLPFCNSILQNYIDDDFDFNKLDGIKSGYVFVNGYFQHLELFPLSSNNEFIRFLDKLSCKLKDNETFNLIRNSVNPIMLHLRRGDYVSNETVRKSMGTCGLDYFKRGIDLISRDLENHTLFVFSDDIEYATNLFKDLKPIHFVKGDTFDPFQDFLLMRCFKHAVISNSTLSYMASILSTHNDNLVVVPSPWFENDKKFRLGIKKNWVYVNKY